MIESLILTMALAGQCECSETVSWNTTTYTPVQYVAPVEYWYGNWSRESEFQADVYYGDKIIRVPVVNGFVPELKGKNGVQIYDYRNQIPYNKCKIPRQTQDVPKRIPYVEVKPKAPMTLIQPKPPVPPKVSPIVPQDHGDLRRPSDVGGSPQKDILPTYRLSN